MLPLLANIALRAAPFIARRFLPKIASAGVRRGIMGATLGGYALAEFDDQEQIQIMDLIESGVPEEQAIEQVKKDKMKTLSRTIPTVVGEGFLAGKMPGAGILGTAIMSGAGVLQGVDSSITRGYGAGDTINEIAMGGLKGSLMGVLETKLASRMGKAKR